MFSKQKRIKVQIAASLLVVGLGIGWLFAVQFKTAPSRVLNPVTPYLSLTQAQATLTKDQEEVKTRIKELKKEVEANQEDIKNRQRSIKNLVEDLEGLKNKTGLTERAGKGLIITLADSSKEKPNIDSIVHAADIRDIVNILWGSEAEAISVNNQRLTATSSIDSIINSILVNNTKITNPFVIRAIGDQKKMQKTLDETNALTDIKRRVKSEGLVFNSEKSDLTLNDFDANFSVNFAKIK